MQVKCDNAGKTDLLQHSKQKKHIDAIKHSVDKKQKKLVAFSKQSGKSSLFFGHAEGEKVAVKMYEQLVSDGIPVAKLVTLVRDGPNVNKTIF